LQTASFLKQKAKTLHFNTEISENLIFLLHSNKPENAKIEPSFPTTDHKSTDHTSALKTNQKPGASDSNESPNEHKSVSFSHEHSKPVSSSNDQKPLTKPSTA
jgi:hypothetical protein